MEISVKIKNALKKRRLWGVVAVVCLIPSLGHAALTQWQVDSNQSTLNFTGVQNGAPLTGSFKTFEGQIAFDPQALEKSKVLFTLDTNSLSFSYAPLVEMAKAPDWLHVKHFPQAKFVSEKITQVSSEHYQMQGALSIRDKSAPVTVDFTFVPQSSHQAQAKGNFVIQRTMFGVGQGEWASTEEIKNDIKVTFDFKLTER